MTHFPLPAFRVPLSRFSAAYGAEITAAFELPDGDVWVIDRDGVLIKFPDQHAMALKLDALVESMDREKIAA